MIKKVLSTISISLFILIGYSQTTAIDWSKKDCDENMHSLYSELDSGNVVLINFVMLYCTPCVTATSYIEQIFNDYKLSHPGRVRVYTFGYLSNYTCKQLMIWKNSYGFTMPMFTDGSVQVEYYGGMGMPTIVVAAGKNHKIFYKKLGFVENDYIVIKDSINSALSSTSIDNIELLKNIEIFPTLLNNENSKLNINYSKLNINKIELINILGSVIKNVENIGLNKNNFVLDLSSLKRGIYYLKIYSDEKYYIKKIIFN